MLQRKIRKWHSPALPRNCRVGRIGAPTNCSDGQAPSSEEPNKSELLTNQSFLQTNREDERKRTGQIIERDDEEEQEEEDDEEEEEMLLRNALLAALSGQRQSDIGTYFKDKPVLADSNRHLSPSASPSKTQELCDGERRNSSDDAAAANRALNDAGEEGRATGNEAACCGSTLCADAESDPFSPIDEGDSELLFSSHLNPLPQHFHRFTFPGLGNLRTRVWTPISEEGSSDLERENESIRGFSRGENPSTPMSNSALLHLTANSEANSAVIISGGAASISAAPSTKLKTPNAMGSKTVDGDSRARLSRADDSGVDLGYCGRAGETGEAEDADVVCGEDKGVERNNSGTSQSSVDSGIDDSSICVS